MVVRDSGEKVLDVNVCNKVEKKYQNGKSIMCFLIMHDTKEEKTTAMFSKSIEKKKIIIIHFARCVFRVLAMFFGFFLFLFDVFLLFYMLGWVLCTATNLNSTLNNLQCFCQPSPDCCKLLKMANLQDRRYPATIS